MNKRGKTGSGAALKSSPNSRLPRILGVGVLSALVALGYSSVQTSPNVQKTNGKAVQDTLFSQSTGSQTLLILPLKDRSKLKGTWDIVNSVPQAIAQKLSENPFYKTVPHGAILERLKDGKETLGKFKNERAIQIGRDLKADFVLTGEIQNFNVTRFRAGVPLAGFFRYGAYVNVKLTIFRVVDGMELGIIQGVGEYDDNELGASYRDDKARQRNKEFFEMGNYEFESEELKDTVVGIAFTRCSEQIKAKIEEYIEPPPQLEVSGPVVLWVQDDEVYVNIGIADGVEAGDKYSVYQEGEDLSDPITGKVVGKTDEIKVGTIQVIEVTAKHFSKARIIEGYSDIKEGNMLRTE